MSLPIRFFIIILLVLLIACSPQEKKWVNATEKNNIASYEEYLKEYPAGKYVENAKDSIANIVCDSAIKSNSIQLLNDFIAKYPNKRGIAKVKQFIEKLDWDTAFSSRSEKMLKECISKHPESPNVKKANDIILTIATELSKAKTIAICSNGGGMIYGCFTMTMDKSGEGNVKPCEPIIYLWRNFLDFQLPFVQKNDLRTGVAYLKTDKNQYRFEKEVDLNKSDEEICSLFGLDRIVNATGSSLPAPRFPPCALRINSSASHPNSHTEPL